MKVNLQKLRWPYRDDALFSTLSFIVFLVPLALSIFADENFETAKFAVWLIFFGCALLVWARRKVGTVGRSEKSDGRIFRFVQFPICPTFRNALVSNRDCNLGVFGRCFRAGQVVRFFRLLLPVHQRFCIFGPMGADRGNAVRLFGW